MDFYFLPCGWVASFLLRLFVVAISVLGQAGPNLPRVSVDPPVARLGWRRARLAMEISLDLSRAGSGESCPDWALARTGLDV